MATWDELREYVKSGFPVTGETDGFLAIEFATGGGRTQMTGVRLMTGGEEQRIRLETKVGWEGDIDAGAALKMNGVLPLGAIAVDDSDSLIFAYSMMLGTLNLASVDAALKTVAYYGDTLERQHSFEDRY